MKKPDSNRDWNGITVTVLLVLVTVRPSRVTVSLPPSLPTGSCASGASGDFSDISDTSEKALVQCLSVRFSEVILSSD